MILGITRTEDTLIKAMRRLAQANRATLFTHRKHLVSLPVDEFPAGITLNLQCLQDMALSRFSFPCAPNASLGAIERLLPCAMVCCTQMSCLDHRLFSMPSTIAYMPALSVKKPIGRD